MTILTEEIVEKAARGLHEEVRTIIAPNFRMDVSTWEQLQDRDRDVCLRQARAALQAVLPDIVEACAKAAEGKPLPCAPHYRGDGTPHIAGLKEAIGLLKELASEFRENGYYSRENTIRLGVALITARITELEKGGE
jgi:hypothetical protein